MLTKTPDEAGKQNSELIPKSRLHRPISNHR